MVEVVFLIGGNLGDRVRNLKLARELLSEKFELVDFSRIFETEAWGGQSKGQYLNQAILVRTLIPAQEVLGLIQEIECHLGRTRELKWGDRTMDIDIIFYGDQIIEEENLVIPHPYMAERRFVLEPLQDLIPEFQHPKLAQSVSYLLMACEDMTAVKPFHKRTRE
jgi:2-amino-4-hydroxy-6-hydroxymethyldihydropteridine diphosphokinase